MGQELGYFNRIIDFLFIQLDYKWTENKETNDH